MQITEVLGSISYILAQADSGGALSYLQEKFVQGGAFMYPILGVLILGLAVSFAKIWSLSRASMNTKKFIVDVKEKLTSGGVSEAMKLC